MADLKTRISGLFSPWQAGVCPGGQVRVVKDGQIVFDEAFGPEFPPQKQGKPKRPKGNEGIETV